MMEWKNEETFFEEFSNYLVISGFHRNLEHWTQHQNFDIT